MNTVELMKKEHEYVSRMLVVIRKMCMNLIDNRAIDCGDFYSVVDFIRNFADGHHHHKEEIFLFNMMVEHLGEVGNKLITHGMLVEHDQGRLFVANLEKALGDYEDGQKEAVLDIIGNSIAYTNLLSSHIDKENDVVFSFASRKLDKAIADQIDEKCRQYEVDNEATREKYISLLENLEAKYLD